MTINTSFMTLGQSARLSAVMIEVPAGRDLVTESTVADCAVAVGIEEPRYQLPALVAVSVIGPESWLIEVHLNSKLPCYFWKLNIGEGSLKLTGAQADGRETERARANLLMASAMETSGKNIRALIRRKIVQGEDTPDYYRLVEFLKAGHEFSPQFRAHFNILTGGEIT